MLQLFHRKTALLRLAGRGAEDQGKIYKRMPGNGEGQLRLSGAGPLKLRHNEGAGIKNCGKSPEPGLVIVLGTEESQHGIRKVAFEQLRRPKLPLPEKLPQFLQSLVKAMSS